MRGPIELLRESWNTFVQHYKLFFAIFLVPGAITLVFDYLTATEQSNEAFMQTYPLAYTLLLLVVVISMLLLSVAMYKAIATPHETNVKTAYQFAFKHFFSYVVLSIVVSVLVILGTIALIIPGIIFGVWFSFSYFVLVFENKGIIDSLKTSRAYVKGHWWGVFGRFLLLGITAFVLSLLVGAAAHFVLSLAVPAAIATAVASFFISFVAMPVTIAYSYLMYLDLKGMRAVEPVVENSPNPAPETAPTPTPVSSPEAV